MASILLFLPIDHHLLLYATLFVILLLSGIGFPIPEEVTLVLGGYLAYLEFIDFQAAMYVLVAGIIVADVIGYLLGRFYGDWLWRNIFSRIRGMDMVIGKAQQYFDRYGEKVVMFSRVFAAVRVAVPILAGHFRMDFKKFLVYDLIGAIPWTVFLVSISYYLGTGLDLLTDVQEVKHLIFAVIILVLGIYAVLHFIRKVYREIKR